MSDQRDVTREEMRQMHVEADGQDPPPPPPPPPFPESVGASTVGSGAGGAALGTLAGVAPAAAQAMGMMQFASADRISPMNCLGWIIIGFVLGAIYGAVKSLIYNFTLKHSQGSKDFVNRFPGAKGLPIAQFNVFHIEERMVHLFRYINTRFDELKKGEGKGK